MLPIHRLRLPRRLNVHKMSITDGYNVYFSVRFTFRISLQSGYTAVRRDLLSLLLHTYPFIHFPRKRWQRSPYKHKLPPHIHLISRVLVVRPTRMATLAQRKIIFIMHCARKHRVYMLEGNTHAARHTVALVDETLLRLLLLLQPKMRQPGWAEIYFTDRHCAVFRL